METTAIEYTTERMDHLGIVAGICKQIDLIEIIDGSLATPGGRKVSCGLGGAGHGAKREIRRQLVAQNETIPDQTGKPTQRPTMRRIAQIFEGIDLLIIHQDDWVVARQVLNMTDVRRKIVSLLGPEVEYCYLVDF